jgi:hypothetical protein
VPVQEFFHLGIVLINLFCFVFPLNNFIGNFCIVNKCYIIIMLSIQLFYCRFFA